MGVVVVLGRFGDGVGYWRCAVLCCWGCMGLEIGDWGIRCSGVVVVWCGVVILAVVSVVSCGLDG